MKEKYNHLTRQERYSIQQMHKVRYTQSAIASCLGCNGSTISRKVRCNRGRRGYRHKQVDEMANQCIFESRKRRKFTPEIQVTGQVRRRGKDTVSPERIYQYV
jgi:IS30 family transposase